MTLDEYKPPVVERSGRYRKREYNQVEIRKIFNVPDDEMLLDVQWDKSLNMIVLTTKLDYDKGKGDI